MPKSNASCSIVLLVFLNYNLYASCVKSPLGDISTTLAPNLALEKLPSNSKVQIPWSLDDFDYSLGVFFIQDLSLGII